MQVYLGSHTKIEIIDLNKCRPYKDFGKGFYVTKFRHHAENWAKKVGGKYETKSFVTEFTFYDSLFTEQLCRVKHFDAYNEEWLDFVVMNRNPLSSVPAHDYDIVEGPVADDKVQNRLKIYLNGRLPKPDFLAELKYHEETHQICFCTFKSLLTLKCTDENVLMDIEHIGEHIVEALMTDYGIDEETAADIFYSSDIFTQLADSNKEIYCKPWREIYKILKLELERKK
jgi:hypothetical protein